MKVGVLVILVLLQVLLLVQSGVTMEETLRDAQKKINQGEEAHCYDRSNSKKHYVSRTYDSFGLENTQTLVYPFCLKVKELGNKLGNFFSEVACAAASGLHFVSVHKQWDLEGSHTNITSRTGRTVKSALVERSHAARMRFLEGLPEVIVHPSPAATAEEGRANVEQHCRCDRYCWQDPSAPWVNHTELISKHLHNAIDSYMNSIPEVIEAGTQVSPDTDFSNAADGATLPIVPDVAIQYRCGDNIGFNYMYGLLPFFAFPPRIPADAQTIYVLSDHPTRSTTAVYSGRCQTIQESLFKYLTDKFPKATVVVKRGGDMFLDYARLARAKVSICSASTYCLWPALAARGKAYFPLTMLVGGADNMQLAALMPTLPKHFEWIEDPLLISDLRKFRPWSQVVEYLLGNIPRPEGT